MLPPLFFIILAYPTLSHDLIRTSCDQIAKFENPKEGFALKNQLLDTLNVESVIECTIHCLKHPSCQSINFKRTANPSHVCELNDKAQPEVALTSSNDFLYYGPSHAPKLNCSKGPGECKFGGECVILCQNNDPICACPRGRTGTTCEELQDVGQFVDLHFPRTSVGDYVLLSDVPQMESFTLMFWINTLATAAIAPLSYALDGSYQELLIVLDKDKLIITIQTSHSRTFYIPPVNDGLWHHLGLLWSNQNYCIFLDGILIYSGNDLGAPTPLKGRGFFAIGQKMNSAGGNFVESLSFGGKLSQMNMWDKFLEAELVKASSTNCLNDVGTIIDWSKAVSLKSGLTAAIAPSECKSLCNDDDYDIAMSASSDTTVVPTYIIASDNIPSMTEFTFTMWVKHFGGSRYVKYATADNDDAIAIRVQSTVLSLRIMRSSFYKARVPMYWKENPSYWHHIGMTWSSSGGIWKVFLDGSLVSIMTDVTSGATISSGGTLVVGNQQSSLATGMSVENSLKGSMSRVNIWDYVIDGEAIWVMAEGPLFENGNVFAWYGVKNKFVGNLMFEATPNTLHNNRKAAEYQMEFPTKSVQNYVSLYNAFKNDLTTISSCFWVKALQPPCGIFSYTTTLSDEEFVGYVKSSNVLSAYVHRKGTSGPSLESLDSWHFFCLQWRSSDGRVEFYRDGQKFPDGNVGQGLAVRGGGAMILGQEVDGYARGFESSQALSGNLTQLNFWDEFLNSDEIQGMAAGVINVNGNLLQWRDLRDKAFGNIVILEKSDPRIPEYPLQKKRDAWCETEYPGAYARLVSTTQANGYLWRCIRPQAMLDENMCYDFGFIYRSGVYFTKSSDILAIQD